MSTFTEFIWKWMARKGSLRLSSYIYYRHIPFKPRYSYPLHVHFMRNNPQNISQVIELKGFKDVITSWEFSSNAGSG